MPTSRTVFLDVDGTIIDASLRLSASVVGAVRRARDAGHLVYLSTGRSTAEIPEAVTQIGFDGVISAGGGFVEHGDTLVAANVMGADRVRDLVEFFARHEIEYMLQARESAHPSAGLLSRLGPIFAGLNNDSGPDDHLVDAMTYRGPAPMKGIAKATFFGNGPETARIVRAGLGGSYHVVASTMPHLGDAGGEVSLPGVNKGTAILSLLGWLKLDAADSIAIGDSANDFEMFDVVGRSIAMGNANPAVKRAADEVTASVDEGGVAAAFARHGLA